MNILEALRDLTLGDFIRASLGDTMWVNILLDIVGVVAISTFCLLIVIFLIWLERKVIARMQDRIGPNRVGKFGLLQTVADVVKLLVKEPFAPTGADKIAYNVAPMLAVMSAIIMWAIVPFSPSLIGSDLNIGIFFFLAVSSASVVVILLAGWGSNNKYALLGAFRAVAQLVSYEVPMVMSLLVPILLSRSMSTNDIINAQTIPFMFVIPVSAVIFFISALAETGRTPFDLLEAESEIVAGFHVEYSGMKFGMFFLAEFVGTLLMSALFATVYMGGWNLPLVSGVLSWLGVDFNVATMAGGSWLGLLVFFVKLFMVYFIFIWIRATWPRVRVDQILDFNWKFLVPLSLVMLLVVAVLDKFNLGAFRYPAHLISHIVIIGVTLAYMQRIGRSRRTASEIKAAETAVHNDHHGHDDHAHDDHHAVAHAH